jgi:hypothetical protein
MPNDFMDDGSPIVYKRAGVGLGKYNLGWQRLNYMDFGIVLLL